VAAIAVRLRIDNVAAQSHQIMVFPFQIQRDGSYRVTDLDELLFAIGSVPLSV
jgi:hypothetical protein